MASTTVTSLLSELPHNTLGYPLGDLTKIFVYLFLPPACALLTYLLLVISDFGLVYQHFSDGNSSWATVTLILMLCPALTSFIFTASSPSLWPSEQPLTRDNLKFLGIQLWYLVGFPFAVIYRYIHQMFWAVDAMFCSWHGDEERREEVLMLLLAPSPLEMYFFLQAYLHSAPQVLLQFSILLQDTTRYRATVSLQLLSIAASLIRMAVITVEYQRFERRKVLGACYPWSEKQNDRLSKCYSDVLSYRQSKLFIGSPSEGDENAKQDEQDLDDEVFENPAKVSQVDGVTQEKDLNEITFANPNDDGKGGRSTLERQKSDSDPEDEIYLKAKQRKTTESSIEHHESESDDEINYRRKISIKEDAEVRRNRSRRSQRSKKYNIVDMSKHTTPPQTPAPRPYSVVAIREMIMSNAESIVERIPRRRYKDDDDLSLPVRVRRTAIKGVEQEDGAAKLVAIVAWLFYLTARMLTIVTFSLFYIIPSAYFFVSHYLLMTFLLMLNSWSESLHRRVFYLFLGYIYVFCLIEFKMKYRNVRLWYGCYFALSTVQNLALTAVWYWAEEWDSWWFRYMAFMIIFCTILSYLCFLVYLMILKPKPKITYPVSSTQS